MEKFGPWNFSVWILRAFEIAKISQFLKLTIFKIFAKSAKIFFSKIFIFWWILELVLQVIGKIEPFFGPKSVFFAKQISLMKKKFQKLIFAIFFFQIPKKAIEKLKCNDFFYFYSILPPKKWGETIKSILTFPEIEISGLLTCVHL